MIVLLGATAMTLAGCGGSAGTYENQPRTPQPIDITGSVNNSRVLISPSAFGAGPISLEVTNAASQSVSLTVQDQNGHPLADLQSINPDTVGEVKFDIGPGDYLVTASQPGIHPAELHVGNERPSAANDVLQP